jgi:cyclic di-GMP phosphodiesterase Gmr
VSPRKSAARPADDRGDDRSGRTTTVHETSSPHAGPPAAAAQTPLDGLAAATLRATAALVLVCDGRGAIRLANPALQRFTGRSQEELLGEPFWDVVTLPQETELARAAVAMVFAGGTAIPGEVDWLSGDGEPRRIELQTSLLVDDGGRPYAIAFVGIDVTVHRQREARVQRLAMTDALTGVANRGALFAVLTARLDAAGAGCGLLFCDLDDFKSVNDRYGHNAGDRLLVEVAERLRRVAGPDDVVARLGGDEFVVLTGCLDPAELAGRASRVEALMAEPFELGGVPLRLGVSTGTAVGAAGDDPDEVLTRADLAMYRTKSVRRSRRSAMPAGKRA